MPIDFFTSPCSVINGNCQKPGIVCKRTITDKSFGLCDAPSPSTLPAYIDTSDDSKWIAQVINNSSKEITFKAIDHCVPIFRSNGELENRCDGMLLCDNELIFVELKDRTYSGWLSKGSEQLISTISSFKANHNIQQYNKIEAYICNKQRPLANSNHIIEMEKFKNATGYILRVNRSITI